MNLNYHKKADIFCADILTVVIAILRKVPGPYSYHFVEFLKDANKIL
jgi:hypothetical protein